MTTKRRPKASERNDRFYFDADRAPLAALEYLHGEVLDTEAFAHAAQLALEFLHGGGNSEQRRASNRAYCLVSATAAVADRAADVASELIARLTKRPRSQSGPGDGTSRPVPRKRRRSQRRESKREPPSSQSISRGHRTP